MMVNPGVSLNEWPALGERLAQWRTEMALDFGIRQSVHAFSDHFPFLMAGVPTGGLESIPAQSGRGYGHTRYDTLDKVKINGLRLAAALGARLAVRMAMDEDWPVERRSATAVAELFDVPAYTEHARYRADFEAYWQAQVADQSS